MITYNINVENKLFNGTRCVIHEINYPEIIVKTKDNLLHTIDYIKYINDLDSEIQYEYIPLKLAYAISIHRAQGTTLDLVEIDLGNDIFGYGMGYVALSRARDLNSIKLIKLSRDSFKCNPKVINFYKNFN
jgi:ATP-dependent DNA helicase PIF1